MNVAQAKKRIAWFSPLEGSSVSAFCSRLLLPLLAQEFDITVFHAGEQGTFPVINGAIIVSHYLTARTKHRKQSFDLFFYNVEDSPDLSFSRMHLALLPGIVWMHDFFMTTHGPEPILNSSWTETVARFKTESHSWPERNRKFPAAQSVAAREVGMSFVSLFSNPRDLAESKRLLGCHLTNKNRRSFLLRHPVAEELFTQPLGECRSLVIGLAARPRVESHVHQVFTALTVINFSGKIIWPVAEIERERALAMVREFDLEGNCEVRIGSGPEAWRAILAEISVGVHVRFSAFGQPAPELAMTLAAGYPALVTDFAAGSTYPKDTVFSIRPGQYEVQEIGKVIQFLDSVPPQVYRAARSYAEEFHHPRVIAAALKRIFYEEAPTIGHYSQRWHELERDAHKELVRESLLPVLTPQSRESGRSFEALLRDMYRDLGWLNEVEVQ